MIAMFKSDLACLRSLAKSVVLMTVFVGVLFAIGLGSMGALAACTVMVPLSLVNNLVAFDEQNGWQRFRMTLPLTRGQVVAGRFLSAAVLVALGWAVGMVACLASYGVTALVPSLTGIASFQMADTSLSLTDPDLWATVVLTSAAGIAIALVMQGAMLIPAMRFGFTKAVRYLPIVAMLVALLLIFTMNAGMQANGDAAWLMEAGAWFNEVLSTNVGVFLMALGVVGVAAVFYVLACLVTMRLYARREL